MEVHHISGIRRFYLEAAGRCNQSPERSTECEKEQKECVSELRLSRHLFESPRWHAVICVVQNNHRFRMLCFRFDHRWTFQLVTVVRRSPLSLSLAFFSVWKHLLVYYMARFLFCLVVSSSFYIFNQIDMWDEHCIHINIFRRQTIGLEGTEDEHTHTHSLTREMTMIPRERSDASSNIANWTRTPKKASQGMVWKMWNNRSSGTSIMTWHRRVPSRSSTSKETQTSSRSRPCHRHIHFTTVFWRLTIFLVDVLILHGKQAIYSAYGRRITLKPRRLKQKDALIDLAWHLWLAKRIPAHRERLCWHSEVLLTTRLAFATQ